MSGSDVFVHSAIRFGGAKRKQSDDETGQTKKPKLPKNYDTSGLRLSLHGAVYQLKLLTLFLKRVLFDIECRSFSLATEMDAAEKFDDLVLAYTSKCGENRIIFLQAKHKQDDSKKITLTDLLSVNDGDFSLQKYFLSYCRVKKKPEFKDFELKDFVICANINLDKNLKGFGQIQGEDEILNFKGCTKFRRLKLDIKTFPEMDKLLEILRSTSKCYRLARLLACCVLKNKRLELKDDLLKEYHTVLGENVIKRIDGEKGIGKFCNEFIDAAKSSDELKKFRKVFYKAYCAVSNEVVDEEHEDEFWKKMERAELKLSSTFGEKSVENSTTSLPDDEIDNKDIDDFFKDIVFSFNQPNEIELGHIIESEIGKVMKLIDCGFMASELLKNMLDWMKEKKGRCLMREEGEAFFEQIKLKMLKLVLIGATSVYFYDKKLQISFTNDNLTKLEEFLKSDKQICNLISFHDTVFGSIKVFQCLKKEGTVYTQDDSFIFMHLYHLLSIQDDVLNVLNSTTNLLIIECKTKESGNVHLFKFYQKLSKVLKKDRNKKVKKVILITLENDVLAGLFENDFLNDDSYEKIEDEIHSFSDLDEQSQKRILKEGKAIFQGKEMSIGAVMDDESKYFLSGKVLSMLINHEKVEIGKPLMDSTHCEIEDYFIYRTFTRNVAIRKIFKNDRNFFIINDKKQGTEPSDLQFEKDIVLISDKRSDFDDLCNKWKLHNVHWLKKENDQFIWQESCGNLTKLRAFVDSSEKSMKIYTPNQITDLSDRVVLLAAEPGMGKSVILSHLSLEAQAIKSHLWIVRSNLADHCIAFYNLKNLKINKLEAVKFLYQRIVGVEDMIQLELIGQDIRIDFERNIIKNLEESQLLEIKLFTHFFNKGKVLLLFDGFDEISPHYKDPVIELVKAFKDTKVKHIWLTSRPYNIQSELENKFSTFSYALKPLTKVEQNHFLKNFWSKNFKLEDFDEEKGNVFIDELLDQFSKSTNDEDRKFFSVPLQIYMIAEIFSKKFEEFYFSGSGEPFSRDNHILLKNLQIDLRTLYKDFIKKKWDVLIKKRYSEMNDSFKPGALECLKNDYKKFINIHEKLAVHLIFKADQLEKVLSKSELEEINKYINEMSDANEKTGIISRIVDNQPQFIHRTFAEYFAAKYIWKKFRSVLLNEFHEKIIQNIMVDTLINDNTILVSKFLLLIAIKHSSKINFQEWESKIAYLSSELINQIEKNCPLEERLKNKMKFPSLKNFKCHVFDKYKEVKYNFQSLKWLLGIIEFSLPERDEGNHLTINQNQSMNLLCMCAEMGYTKLVQKSMRNLCTGDLKVNLSQSSWSFSPLWAALENDQQDIVKLLVKDFSYDTNWVDEYGKNLIGYLLYHGGHPYYFTILKTCLELNIVNCEPYTTIFDEEDRFSPYDLLRHTFPADLLDAYYISTENDVNLVLPIYEAMLHRLPSDVIKLLIEKTDADLLNKFAHYGLLMPGFDVNNVMWLQYDVEIIELARKKGFDLSFCVNDILSKFLFQHFVQRLFSCEYATFGNKLFNLFQVIEQFWKTGVGCNHVHAMNVNTYTLVKRMYDVHEVLHIVHKAHKHSILYRYLHPKQTLLKLLINSIMSIPGLNGVKIRIGSGGISVSPNFLNKSMFRLVQRTFKTISSVIKEHTSQQGFNTIINSEDLVYTISFQDKYMHSGDLLSHNLIGPFPYLIISELIFKYYMHENDNRNLMENVLRKLKNLKILREGSKPTIREVFPLYPTRILGNFEEIDCQSASSDNIEENKYQNESINELVNILLHGIFSLHFTQEYEITDALNKLSKKLFRLHRFLCKLLEIRNLSSEEDIILDNDRILNILNLEKNYGGLFMFCKDQKESNLEYLVRDLRCIDSTEYCQSSISVLISIWIDLNDVSKKTAMEVLEELLEYYDQSSLIFELFMSLHESFHGLFNAVIANDVKSVCGVLKNVKQDFVRAVIHGVDHPRHGSPLHYAVSNGQVRVTRVLLHKGANPNLRLLNSLEFFVLSRQFEENEAREKQRLSIYLDFNWTPLYFAVLNGNLEMVQILISYGAVVSPVITRGQIRFNTPLHLSAVCDHLQIVQSLLENGARYNVQNKEGKTPSDLAMDGSDVHNLLDWLHRMFQTVENGGKNAVNSLFEEIGVDSWKAMLNARNIHGKTLLNLARDNEQQDIVGLLIEKLRFVGSALG